MEQNNGSANDRCKKCGCPRGSSIHSTDSQNVEIKHGSHTFVPSLTDTEAARELRASVRMWLEDFGMSGREAVAILLEVAQEINESSDD